MENMHTKSSCKDFKQFLIDWVTKQLKRFSFISWSNISKIQKTIVASKIPALGRAGSLFLHVQNKTEKEG